MDCKESSAARAGAAAALQSNVRRPRAGVSANSKMKKKVADKTERAGANGDVKRMCVNPRTFEIAAMVRVFMDASRPHRWDGLLRLRHQSDLLHLHHQSDPRRHHLHSGGRCRHRRRARAETWLGGLPRRVGWKLAR